MTRWVLLFGLICAGALDAKGFVVRPTEVQSREYRELAREIDQSRDPVLVDRRASLERVTQGERVTSRWFRATRATD